MIFSRHSQISIQRGLAAIALALTTLALEGCGGGDTASQPSPSSPSAKTTKPNPAPSYSLTSIKMALLTEEELGKGIRNIDVALLPFKEQKAPICSLSGKKLPGKPDLIFRQYTNQPKMPRNEIKYAQMFARYNNSTDATSAYNELVRQTKKCPAKQHVAARKIDNNRILYAHNDTWHTSKESIEGWQHLRGIETQSYSRSYTKFNVLHFMYDYSLRGNLLITTVYWERTEPDNPGKGINKRATEVLKKQLKKFG